MNKLQPVNDLTRTIEQMHATSINLPERANPPDNPELRPAVTWERAYPNANPKLKHYPPYRGQ